MGNLQTMIRKILHYRIAAVFSLCALILILFVIAFIQREHAIYFWDTVGFNDFANEFSSLLNSPQRFASRLWNTIRNYEYNATPIVLPSLIVAALGGGRLGYIISLVLTYHLPLYLLVFFVSWKYFSATRRVPTLLGATILVVLFTTVHFWRLTLSGLPDVCTLIALSTAIYIGFSVKVEEKIHISSMLALGASLYACFLLRRWSGFAMATFYVVYFSTPFFFLKKRNILKSIITMTANAVISAGTTLLLALLLQYKYILRAASDNYGTSYSAYWDAVGWRNYLTDFYTVVGPLLLVLLLLAPIVFYYTRTHKRHLVFFAIFLCVYPLAMTLFSGTAPHHKLPFALFSVFIGMYSLFGLDRLLQNHKHIRRFALISTLLLSLFLFGASMTTRIGSGQGISRLIPTGTLRPLRHPGYGELQSLYSDLSALVRGTPERTVILSSSLILNDSLFYHNAGDAIRKSILFTPQVDKRDGIGLLILSARYVIIGVPIQYHLLPDDQQVISVPAQQILNHEGIGKAYERIGRDYSLGAGVVARIYQKTRALTVQEIQELLDAFPADSKSWPHPVTRDELLFASMDSSLGDVSGAIEFQKDGQLFIHPGETTPTTVIFRDHNVSTCTVTVQAFIPRRILSELSSASTDGVSITFSSDGQELAHAIAKYHEKQTLTFNLRESKEFSISVNAGNFPDETRADFVFTNTFR